MILNVNGTKLNYSAVAFLLLPVIIFLFDRRTRNMFRNWNKSNEWKENEQTNNMTLEIAYEILGMDPDATMDQIKSRYKRLARKHHPDKGGSYPNWHRLEKAMTNIKKERNLPT